MKGDIQVISILNQVLSNELISINQTFLHARMFKNWGLASLNKLDFKVSIDAMKRADKLIERILFLEGLPNLQDLGKLKIGEHSQEMLQCDLSLTLDCVAKLREGVKVCEAIQDYVSRDLLENLLEDEEELVDDYETQLSLIEKTGIKNYLQSQMSD
ncbi:MAG: bacterioferritin [Saccharospirillaceae bacterium]|nr:bacterioferritin [Pseudomonadales bacterium]NRB78585.1 bacterioferritin [Saccharospirillaceae bacterium]